MTDIDPMELCEQWFNLHYPGWEEMDSEEIIRIINEEYSREQTQ